MSGARSVRRSVGHARVAIAAAAVGVCGAWSAAAWANTAVTVVGSSAPTNGGTNPGNLRATQAYSNNAAPTSSTDVVITSGTINPSGLLLDSVSSTVTISVGSLDDTNTGVLSQIANNGSSGASYINLGGGSGTNTVGSASDLIYVAAGSGTAFNITGGVASGHTFNLTLEQSGNIDVGAGSTFYYNQGASGSLGLGSNALTTTGGGNVTLAGNVTGAGSLTVAGTGTVAITVASTYTGATNVLSGTLQVGSATASANLATSGVNVSSGAQLTLSQTGTTFVNYAFPVTLNGSAALTFAGSNINSFNLSGGITLANTGSQTATIGETDALDTVNLLGVISGSGNLNIAPTGNGNKFLVGIKNVETYAGNTTLSTVAGGDYPDLQLAAGGALPATTVLTINNNQIATSPSARFDLNGQSQTLAGLASTGANASTGLVINSTNGTTSGLTINAVAGTSYTFAGSIGSTTASTSNISLTTTGAGVENLSGRNYYTGGTTISAGTLQANNATSSLGAGLATVNGGVLAGGTVAVPGATGGGGLSLVSGTITGGTGATATDKVGTLIVGTAATATAAVTLNGSGIAYVAKVDPSLVAGPGTSETTANSPATAVAVYAGASDELVVSNFTAGSSSVLTVDPMMTSNGSGGSGPLSPGTYYFVIANATGASQSNLSGFLSQFTLAAGSTPDAAGDTYSLDAAADAANGGDDLLLDLTVASPEPTSLLLAGLAAAPLALGRRRRPSATVRS
jgi:fibronectin-binding autotransporter adhesin